MRKIQSFSIKILLILLKVILGILGIYLAIYIFVSIICLTANVGGDSVNSYSHEDAWIIKGYESPDWKLPDFNFDPKEWNLPTSWAPE